MREAVIDPPRRIQRPGSDRSRTSAAVAAQRLGGGRDTGGAGRRKTLGSLDPPRPGLAARCRAATSRLKPVRAICFTLFAAALAGIVANAVLFQKGRHPAPLFGSASAPPDAPSLLTQAAILAPPRTAPAPVTAPPVTPAEAAPATTDTVPAAPQQPTPAKAKPVASRHPASRAHRDDAIGRLLAGEGSPAQTERGPDAVLLAAQRHLKSLGYAVKPGGHMDAATRRAITHFERDHHLKADGTVTPHVLSEVAAAAQTAQGR